MTGELESIREVERAWALDAVAFAAVLARHDPSWRSEWFELAGGHAVLCGPGLYVNRAVAAGHDEPITGPDLERLEQRSAAVGVEPAVEVGPATHPEVPHLLARRRYVVDDLVAAFRWHLDRRDQPDREPADDTIVVERADGDLLQVWQETSAVGWGHTDPAARRASDAFARAAAVVDGAGFVIARHADDGRPVGCASLTIRGGIATLGGMSTPPAERGRGVQGALIRHRLRIAAAAGCSVATSTARPDGASARNLVRVGFEPWFAKTTWGAPSR